MGLETTTTIENLNSSWPLSSDPRTQGDDHIRQIKDVLKRTFPGTGGSGFNTAISATETELNYIHGLTGPIQELLDAKAPLASPALTGTPTTSTPSSGNNSQQIPNTSWVNAAIASTALRADTSAKAWGKLSAAGGIYASYGVASITDEGTGQVLVTLSNAFTGANGYNVIAGAGRTGPGVTIVNTVSATQFRLYHYTINLDGLHDVYELADPSSYHFACFGDLA